MVQAPVSVAAEAEVECPVLPVPVRAVIVFVRNVGTRNCMLSDSRVIKIRARSVVRK